MELVQKQMKILIKKTFGERIELTFLIAWLNPLQISLQQHQPLNAA
jgi:hypothetical protein